MAKRKKKPQKLTVRDGKVVISKRVKVDFTEPIGADTFMSVRDECYADMLRQIQPKHKSAEVL